MILFGVIIILLQIYHIFKIFFWIILVDMAKKLSDDEVAELLQGDISDIEELDEGDDINIDNLNEILNQFPDTFDVSIPVYYI